MYYCILEKKYSSILAYKVFKKLKCKYKKLEGSFLNDVHVAC